MEKKKKNEREEKKGAFSYLSARKTCYLKRRLLCRARKIIIVICVKGSANSNPWGINPLVLTTGADLVHKTQLHISYTICLEKTITMMIFRVAKLAICTEGNQFGFLKGEFGVSWSANLGNISLVHTTGADLLHITRARSPPPPSPLPLPPFPWGGGGGVKGKISKILGSRGIAFAGVNSLVHTTGADLVHKTRYNYPCPPSI